MFLLKAKLNFINFCEISVIFAVGKIFRPISSFWQFEACYSNQVILYSFNRSSY